MLYALAHRAYQRELTRRDLIRLMAASTASLATPAILGGCATDPVTGKTTLVGLSEADEVAIDRQQSPHQFSSDYGAVQDPRLNGYLTQAGPSTADALLLPGRERQLCERLHVPGWLRGCHPRHPPRIEQ